MQLNELKIFKNSEFGQVRVLEKDGQILFAAKDICEALNLTNTTVALQRLDPDEVAKLNLGGLSGETNFVNEYGLYNLVLASRKPEAKKFKRWVTHEVLPSIRKTGGYVANDDLFIQTYLPYADSTTKEMFKQTLFVIRKQNEQIQIMQPKAEYFDELVDRNLLTNFRDTAKELKIPQKTFVEFLLDKKYIYRDQKGKLMPYADKNSGLFEVKEYASRYSAHAGVQTLITPKGRETFRLLLQKAKGGGI